MKMDNYRFQDVLCPFCKKSYMTRVFDEYSVIVKQDGKTLKGWRDRCPKCDSEVFVVENDFYGKDLSNYTEEEIQEFWYLR